MRVRKQAGSDPPIDYLVDPYNQTGYAQVFKETQGVNSTVYILGHDVLAQADPAHVQYLLYDGHGSVRQLADNSGSAVAGQIYQYDAYGNEISTALPLTTLLYAGEMYDADLEWYYNRARWYNPATGRFNRADPFEGNYSDPQSLHRYLYAHSNPTNGLDPSGLTTLLEIQGAASIRSLLTEMQMCVYDGVQTSAQIATSGASFKQATGLMIAGHVAPFIIGPLVNVLGDLIDDLFSSLSRRFGNKIKIQGRVLEGVADYLGDIYNTRTARDALGAEAIGELGAAWTAQAKGFKRVKFTRATRGGFDQIWRKGNTYIIVEAKGGSSDLITGQMSRDWIEKNITNLRNTDPLLAKKLAAAADNGRLNGMVVRTRVEGANAFNPRFVLREWDEIGELTWSGR
jgi:RHS repeat-associated protein